VRARLFARAGWGLSALVCAWALAAAVWQLAGPGAAPAAGDLYGVAFLGLVLVGLTLLTGLILLRQPHNLIGWLLLVPQTLLATGLVGNGYLAGLAAAPATAGWPLLLLLWLLGASWIPFIYSLVLLPVFFPTGRPPSPRWWWLVGALLIHGAIFLGVSLFSARLGPEDGAWSVPNPIGFISDEQFGALFAPWLVVLAGLVVACLAALFVRYARASAMVRTQIRWLLYACSLFVLIYVPQLFIPFEPAASEPTAVSVVLNAGFAVTLLLIPAAIAVAILRYRLFDIDLIIRRTLVYSALTALLALAYFGSVLVLQNVFQALTGEGQNALATVLSTLTIAALFGPLRGRVQRAIDRRFYRQKYDAAHTLAAFGARARDVVELDLLSDELVQAVEATMQPAHVGLWMKPGDRPAPG